MADEKKNPTPYSDADISIMKSDIAAAHVRIEELISMYEKVADEFGERLVELGRRLTTLEEFLPILGEHFAGRLAGTSEDSAAVFEALRDVNPDALREALERHAADAKTTEVPPTNQILTPEKGVEEYAIKHDVVGNMSPSFGQEIDNRPAYMRE